MIKGCKCKGFCLVKWSYTATQQPSLDPKLFGFSYMDPFPSFYKVINKQTNKENGKNLQLRSCRFKALDLPLQGSWKRYILQDMHFGGASIGEWRYDCKTVDTKSHTKIHSWKYSHLQPWFKKHINVLIEELTWFQQSECRCGYCPSSFSFAKPKSEILALSSLSSNTLLVLISPCPIFIIDSSWR